MTAVAGAAAVIEDSTVGHCWLPSGMSRPGASARRSVLDVFAAEVERVVDDEEARARLLVIADALRSQVAASGPSTFE